MNFSEIASIFAWYNDFIKDMSFEVYSARFNEWILAIALIKLISILYFFNKMEIRHSW